MRLYIVVIKEESQIKDGQKEITWSLLMVTKFIPLIYRDKIPSLYNKGINDLSLYYKGTSHPYILKGYPYIYSYIKG